jgi:hypothetical protein
MCTLVTALICPATILVEVDREELVVSEDRSDPEELVELGIQEGSEVLGDREELERLEAQGGRAASVGLEDLAVSAESARTGPGSCLRHVPTVPRRQSPIVRTCRKLLRPNSRETQAQELGPDLEVVR